MEQRLEELGLKAAARVLRDNRAWALQHGDLVYLSSRIPADPDGSSITGKVGNDLLGTKGTRRPGSPR